MMRVVLVLTLFACALVSNLGTSSVAYADESAYIPRKLLAFYDSRYEKNLRTNTIHRFLGLPANRLGYTLDYHDINDPLPVLDSSTHGILIWFHHGPIPEREAFLQWLADSLRSGKRLIVLENLGIGRQDSLSEKSLADLKYIYERMGVRDNGVWYPLTYKSKIIHRDAELVDFERRLTPPLAPFGQLVATSAGTSHMRLSVGIGAPGEYADVVMTGPQGGYAASGYVYHEQQVNDNTISAWYLNPFTFLQRALNPPLYPVPDVTTHNGRRIFYSHIDGDGWNNRTHVENYKNQFSSKVILEEILKPYSDFAFSVGLVAGDLADNCFGSELSREIARNALALPNVEVASHTYTHPLYWQFFKDYSPEKEKDFASNFPKPAGLFSQDYTSLLSGKKKLHRHDGSNTPSIAELKESPMIDRSEEAQMRELLEMYDVPRSFNCMPFDEENEIYGANKVIESLAPEGKKVTLMQWSGNTSPYERFLRKTREAGMFNINGGESRYDAEYPSYSTLYPIGIRMGDELQIYSTASNENTYTNLWSERFFGYRYLIETVRHTETPIRLAPFNVYFHSYSGERPGSLKALKEIMLYARKHELIPLVTSQYAAIANGFYSANIEPVGYNHWIIHDRGALQTFRIASPALTGKNRMSVDLQRSKGVLGSRIYQENMYIFLNPAIDKPELFLVHSPSDHIPAKLSLSSSRWNILSAKGQSETSIDLMAQGYGRGEMQWRVPVNGLYRATITPNNGEPIHSLAASENNVITLVFDGIDATTAVNIRITLKEAAQ
ncbi:MAG: hypothetical protein MK052_10590 [Alphaproteobacteria bacterium]|nr:hypothetical protein [Alphaproteobacteria bacterium]